MALRGEEGSGSFERRDESVALSSFSIGVWRARPAAGKHVKLLVLHSTKKFVFLLDRATPRSKVSFYETCKPAVTKQF